MADGDQTHNRNSLPLLNITNPTPKHSLIQGLNPVFKRPSESGELAANNYDVTSSVSSMISMISMSSEESVQQRTRMRYEKKFVRHHERWKRRGLLCKKIMIFTGLARYHRNLILSGHIRKPDTIFSDLY